jgi:hypothetical protein
MPTLTEEEYLEHFGILGMHWGTRKVESGTSNSGSKKSPAKSGLSRKSKIGIGVGVGLVAAGGVAAAIFLSKNKAKKLNELRKSQLADQIKRDIEKAVVKSAALKKHNALDLSNIVKPTPEVPFVPQGWVKDVLQRHETNIKTDLAAKRIREGVIREKVLSRDIQKVNRELSDSTAKLLQETYDKLNK